MDDAELLKRIDRIEAKVDKILELLEDLADEIVSKKEFDKLIKL